ncbi:MAG: type II toxin-antitoxin system VapC family toxin [Acidobacteria bacterium]|nr:type II toxin-antitoxin system VapC family toxin [Acidobacteriota bacterium]
MILLDTHVILWLESGSEQLGRRSRKIIDGAFAEADLAASSISFWEIAMLTLRKRLSLSAPPEQLRADLLTNGLLEIPLTGDIAIAATSLEHLHADPADRFIIATAVATTATLVTADTRILDWKGRLKRHDARI